MKKFITLAMAAVMIFAMAGCQSAKEETEKIENDVEQAVDTVKDDVEQAVDTVKDDAESAVSKVEAEVSEIEQTVKDKLKEDIAAIPQDAALAKEKAMEVVTDVKEKFGVDVNKDVTAETLNGEWKAYAILYGTKYITLASFGVEAVDLYVDSEKGEASVVYDIGDEEPVGKSGNFEITDGVAVFDGELSGMIAYLDQSDPNTLMFVSTEDGSSQLFMMNK